MEPSIAGGRSPSRAAVLVLSPGGLVLARRLRAAWPGMTAIFGPSAMTYVIVADVLSGEMSGRGVICTSALPRWA